MQMLLAMFIDVMFITLIALEKASVGDLAKACE